MKQLLNELSFAPLSLFLILLIGCSDTGSKVEPQWFTQKDPQKLSDWQLFTRDGRYLHLAPQTTEYRLATPLFSDYAEKLRTIYLPDQGKLVIDEAGNYDFPVGSIVTKSFYYEKIATDASEKPNEKDPGKEVPQVKIWAAEQRNKTELRDAIDLNQYHMVETRLLIKRSSGWTALPYIWNDAQNEAFLAKIGGLIDIEAQLSDANGVNRTKNFPYLVPNINQCAGCHAHDRERPGLQLIGLDPSHQLETGQSPVSLSHDENPSFIGNWRDEGSSIDQRARAYLHSNCAHCHTPAAPHNSSALDLRYEAKNKAAQGHCKIPIAAGQGTGGLPWVISPGQPQNSILLYRMRSDNPGEMMPELGRTLVHDEAAELIEAWIAEMPGSCD